MTATPAASNGAFAVRLAVPGDEEALRQLIAASVIALQKDDYTAEQLALAVETVFTLDTQLVTDGTYFVVEPAGTTSQKSCEVVACGGWSRRKTLCGGDHHAVRDNAFLDPNTDAAKIRAFFVRPGWERRGLGSLLLRHCEEAAQAAGFTRFEMAATLTGVPLYRSRGYAVVEETSVPLRDGLMLPVVIMARQMVGPRG